MADLKFYRPNPVALPDHVPDQRKFPEASKVDQVWRDRLDTRTLFYDIYFDEAERRIMGIGPGLLNLRSLMSSMSAYVDGRKLEWKLRSIKRLIFLESERLHEVPDGELPVEFRFSKFSQALRLPTSIADISDPGLSCPLTISTLQKDNPLIWIADWLKWHHREHGVGRAVLYDNGSSNRDELIDCLKALDLDMRIVFVDWVFPFGNRPTKSCQLGSLNHCRLRFPIHGGYCINNDIDEYVFYSKGNLIDYLRVKLRHPAPGAVLYKGISVPNIIDSEHEFACVADFQFVEDVVERKELKLLPRHYQTPKYIYRFDGIGYNGVHNTDSIKNRSFAKRYSIAMVLMFLIKKMLRESCKPIQKYAGYKFVRPRIDAVYAPESELCFLHFRGLNTGWMYNVPRVDYNSSMHKLDKRLRRLVNFIDDVKFDSLEVEVSSEPRKVCEAKSGE